MPCRPIGYTLFFIVQRGGYKPSALCILQVSAAALQQRTDSNPIDLLHTFSIFRPTASNISYYIRFNTHNLCDFSFLPFLSVKATRQVLQNVCFTQSRPPASRGPDLLPHAVRTSCLTRSGPPASRGLDLLHHAVWTSCLTRSRPPTPRGLDRVRKGLRVFFSWMV